MSIFSIFKRKPKRCPHFRRDLSVIGDRHVGCRTCKRRIGKWPCKVIAIKGVPTLPDVPPPPDVAAALAAD